MFTPVILRGQKLRLKVRNRATLGTPALAMGLQAYLVPLDGSSPQEIQQDFTLTTTNLSREDFVTTASASKDSLIMSAVVGHIGTGGKRGETFATVRVWPRGTTILAGYVYQGVQECVLGNIVPPTSGKGFLHWVQEADDIAGNATETVNLALSNARRIVRGVIVKYHRDGNAATATLTITLRDLATAAGPTGWSIASDTWVSPTLTLTANEEGLIHVGEHGFVSTNDAGTLAYADNSSAPNPFPFEVQDGDTVDLIIAAGSGVAGDDFDVWVQYEDWVEV